MATKRTLSNQPSLVANPLVRILGHHRAAHEVLQQATQKHTLPIAIHPNIAPPTADYTLIDPALAIEPTPTPMPSQLAPALPPTGVGYAAFTPSQRHALLQWLNQPEQTAPPALAMIRRLP